MPAQYRYQKLHRLHPRRVVRRRIVVLFMFLLAIGLAIVLLTLDLSKTQKDNSTISSAVQSEIENTITDFKSPYFRFSDTGKWVYSKVDSKENEYVYYKYRGLDIEHRLTVYVNKVPIPDYLAASRALPVRIVNGNSLDAANVSGPCVGKYGVSELHKVKVVSVEGADMLCDPDTPQYSVALAEISGDWRLDMERPSGEPVQFVITYRDYRLDPDNTSIRGVAGSFTAL
ncbi:hypothetical protein A2884_02470 [Candidatus Saccharibacteria bacterium RIFCSPHIGHO2_01_FULL_48_12]|nr:MAG: hypothetical protein A2884_02470 [Candidatus Saccharibacteria bacterium RIFCSPHIGHO2_01_FULL_48_12]